MAGINKISSERALCFFNAISNAKNEGKEKEIKEEVFKTKNSKWFGSYVHTYDKSEYEEVDHLFLIEGNIGGFAIKAGDIVSVFKHPKKAKPGLLDTLIPKAINLGGTHLDCFNGVLPKMYSKFKFFPVAKVRFNRDYAPEDWNYERDQEPDIIFMIFKKTISFPESVEERGNLIKNQISSLVYSIDYDNGKEAQKIALKAEKI